METDLETALFVAKRINQKVKEVNFLQEVQKEGISLKQLPEGGKLTVTVSIGAASFDGKDLNMTAEQLIHKADMALYRAKEEGRDRICL